MQGTKTKTRHNEATFLPVTVNANIEPEHRADNIKLQRVFDIQLNLRVDRHRRLSTFLCLGEEKNVILSS